MCDICRQQTPCYYQCPNYIPPKKYYNFICSYCNEGIYDGEEYIESYRGDYVHKDCIPSSDWLIDWYGIDIKETEE